MNIKRVSLVLGVVILSGIATSVAHANNYLGYHWARTANPFTLELGDNVSPQWRSYLTTTSNDWSVSSVLNTVIKPGKSNVKSCRPTLGRVEVCSSKYGMTGWLGVAQMSVNGDHITSATTKVNDSYFASGSYNTPAWRNLVMCQEVGHTFGLDHQDVDFNNANLGTCMDYTSDPTTNQHPNAHDYEELGIIYAHLDSVNTIKSTATTVAAVGQDIDLDNPSAWGKAIKKDSHGKDALYVRDLGNNEKVITHVIWAE